MPQEMPHYPDTGKKNAQGLSGLVPFFRTKRILLGLLAVIMILVTATLLTLFGDKNNGFITYQRHTAVFPVNETLHTVIDDTPLAETVSGSSYKQLRTSIDGSIAAFMTDRKELYIVKDRHLKKIADDVHHYEISVNGTGIAFAIKYVDDYSLFLYSVTKNERHEVTAKLSQLDFSLSPDGKSVAYYTKVDDQDTLMCYSDNKNLLITSDATDLVGLSNGGRYIYAIQSKAREISYLYAYNYRGEYTQLGMVTSSSFKFNTDHRQIMFYNNGKTFISVNGEPAAQYASGPLYMVTVPNSQSASDENSITYPTKSLFNHVYTCSDGESTCAWLIRRNPETSEKLASKVSGCTLDASAKYLYYLYDLNRLQVLRIADGEGAADQAKTLAEKATTYAVTPDRSKVYFTKGTTLYSTGSNGRKIRTICEDASEYELVVNRSGVAFYISQNELFSCSNSRKGTPVAKNVQSVFGSSNYQVYILADDGIWTVPQGKHPKQILSYQSTT